MLLIGSPMCTAFSAWQRINNRKRDASIVSKEYIRAMVHIRFTMELYKIQHAAGRYFLHEHPAYATSWQEEAMAELMKEQGIETAVCDQCMYGSKDLDGSPVKKPTLSWHPLPSLRNDRL